MFKQSCEMTQISHNKTKFLKTEPYLSFMTYSLEVLNM